MRHFLFTILILAASAAQALDGRWIGEYRLGGKSVFVRASFDGVRGTLESPGRFLAGGEPEGARYALAVRNAVPKIAFTATGNGKTFEFSGSVAGSKLAGEVRANGAAGTFELIRLADLDRAAQRRFVGGYQFSDGSAVFVEELAEIRSLFAIMIPSGRIGPIEAISPTSFVLGPGMLRRYPVEQRFDFAPDGASLTVGGRRAQRIRAVEEEVSFANGAVKLAGTLSLPPGRGPHPAVVLIHGGGGQTREFGWVVPFFTRLGVAVLAYDKRGTGSSTGDWRTAAFDDLAGDALAGVDLLRGRADIDRTRIGLYGSSNGAWVAPVAAAKRPDAIAFVIARSASYLTNRENVVFEAETDLRAHGFGGDAVARMRALHQQDMAVVTANGAGYDELRQVLARAAAAEPWFRFARLPGAILEMNDANRQNIMNWIAAQHRDVDPRQIWPRVKAPVLIQTGSADEYVPGEESVRVLRAALSSNRDATVKLYPNGTHPLFESKGGRVPDYSTVTRLVPGYLGDLEAWVRRVGLTGTGGEPVPH
jgi:pimeloyl-ACP methyl ester carboxylesterase